MNKTLPIYPFKDEIVKAVNDKAVTIITAQTGSGKSTQVPQFLYEAGYNVVVTEPRRMAAWSLASRVSEEMQIELGTTVGFRTGFERNDSPNTSILYCTDGLELVRELADVGTNSRNKKVLIIDEVHEWNLNIETLIAWVKKQHLEGWSTKVVIMSATMEKGKLTDFFGDNSVALEVPGKLFHVSVEERLEESLIYSVQEMITEGRNTLVFVPGKAEIEKVIDEIKRTNLEAVVLPLHGEMDYEDQKKCFKEYSSPKVVVATNVAQTSITIPDIDAVIDTGKEKRVEVRNNIQGLFLRDISKADCIQRQGRAGRTKEGRYILCSNTTLCEREEFCVAEIQRGILDQIVLRLATCGIDATSLEFFHQPKVEALENAMKTLIELGAIKNNGEVTSIGYKMAKMPVSVIPARMIIEAEKYGVTEDIIIIAAILQNGSLLDRKEGYYSYFTNEYQSDLLAELDIWRSLEKEKWIDFGKLKINKKIYFRVKEYVKKMKEVLNGVVEITSSGKREDIKKCIIVSMIVNLFKEIDNFGDRNFYINKEKLLLDNLGNNTCVKSFSLFVGLPIKIEFPDSYGIKRTMNILTMVTGTSSKELKEIFPDDIKIQEGEPDFSYYSDCARVKQDVYFRDFLIEEKIDIRLLSEYPEYKKLKEEYEKKQENLQRKIDAAKEPKQAYVFIDGKAFEVKHTWNTNYFSQIPYICIDEETLFSTNESKIYLDNGVSVKVTTESYYKKVGTIKELRNIVESERIKYAWNRARTLLPKLADSKLSTILEAFPKETRVLVINSNGGEGEPIYGYICLNKENKSICFELEEDEEVAKAKTYQTVIDLYDKAICENYYDNKFRVKKSKKGGFTPKEEKLRNEFYSEVRELSKGLEISNIGERLMYLEELYNELIEELF